MNETVQLVVFESQSLPKGYKALETMSEQGLEPLEFSPHAGGVRIVFKAPQGFSKSLPEGSQMLSVSLTAIKAMLSQTGHSLKNFLCIVETKKYVELLMLAGEFEKIGAEILEIRSLRSNAAKNYALFTLDDKAHAAKLLTGFEHSFLSASSAVLKEFLGFK